MSAALLPCPFCGAPAEIEHGSDHHGEWFNLGCSRHWGKDLDSPCVGGRLWYTETEVTEDDAIAAWNRRAPSPAEAALREALAVVERLSGVPLIKSIERILDEHSAWIARPSPEVTKAVALAAGIAGAEANRQAASEYERHLEAEVERLTAAMRSSADDIEQTLGKALGKALGYPWFRDDQANFPGATEAQGVCVGDHVAESLATEAARTIADLKAASATAYARGVEDAARVVERRGGLRGKWLAIAIRALAPGGAT
jgi:hypothetical protein